MSKGYNKKVILFYPGASGNFLASFLVVDSIRLPAFRVDHRQELEPGVVVASGGGSVIDKRLQDFDSLSALASIKNFIEHGNKQVILSHYQGVSSLRNYTNCWIKKIYPETNILGWIKNVHFKKQEIEIIDYSQAGLSTRVDQCLFFIQGWYEIFKADTDRPKDMTIDFGRIYDINYLTELFEDANGFKPDKVKIQWAQKYLDLQFPRIDYVASSSMSEIIDHIKPKDFFDLAAVLFIYENYYNTVDKNRNWSIDQLPNNIEDALNFLLDNQKNYTIF